MSSWMINIELPVERVRGLLRTIEGATFTDIPGGIGLDFGDQRVAWVGDALPDAGTDIIVKDASETIGRLIYAFLADRTSGVMWMTDDGGLLRACRGVTADELGLDAAVDLVPPRVDRVENDGPLRSDAGGD